MNIVSLFCVSSSYLKVLTRVRCHDTLSFQNARLVTGGIGSCFFLWLQQDEDVRAWAKVALATLKELVRVNGVLNDCRVVNDMRCNSKSVYAVRMDVSGKPLGRI